MPSPPSRKSSLRFAMHVVSVPYGPLKTKRNKNANDNASNHFDAEQAHPPTHKECRQVQSIVKSGSQPKSLCCADTPERTSKPYMNKEKEGIGTTGISNLRFPPGNTVWASRDSYKRPRGGDHGISRVGIEWRLISGAPTYQ
jgi:hypothetical protein